MSLLDVWQQVREELVNRTEDEDEVFGSHLESEDLAFADRLLRSYAHHQALIDDRLQEVIEGWSFSQMAQTDLNVLRLALTELLYEKEVPQEVTLEIAVRIAKKYGGEESGRFVNGVLAKVVRANALPSP
jgi:N utilization substance protein B